MSPIWANQTQDTLGSGVPHNHHAIDCENHRAKGIMGTVFEPAFCGFPVMESYGRESFVSFGPAVDFKAGPVRPEQWLHENISSNETSLSSETPGMPIPYYLETA